MSFDLTLCAQYVEQLVLHDEVERALLVLDNVPAFYRDNPPEILRSLKADILRAKYTPHDYVRSNGDANVEKEHAAAILHGLDRGRIIDEDVARYNGENVAPHIVDMGPGTYFVPFGLKAMGRRFTYYDIALNARAIHAASEIPRTLVPEQEQPLMFLAMEVIEHIPDTRDIVTEALKHCGKWPDRVLLSTPLYTYDTASHKEWRTNEEGLPHLRAYTPSEFYLEAVRLFPGYDWKLDPSRVMSLRGSRK